jgi:putative transposase
VVHVANIQEREGAKLVLAKASNKGLFRLQKVLADDGYSGRPMMEFVKQEYGWEFESIKRPREHQFEVMHQRWKVERTFGWLNNFRGLSKHYDFYNETCEAKMLLGSIFYLTRRLTRPPDYSVPEINMAHELKLSHIRKKTTQVT